MCARFFDSIPDAELRATLLQHITGKREPKEDTQKFLRKLRQQEKDLYWLDEFDNEVTNGGFNQYFFNTNGAFIDDTITALRTICGDVFSQPLQQASRHYKHQDHIHKETRAESKNPAELLKGFLDSQDSIDFFEEETEWYRLRDSFHSSLIRFIRTNKDAFLDSKPELELSDWLHEPDQYFDNAAAHKLSLDALKNWRDDDPIGSRSRLARTLLEGARKQGAKGKYREAEAILQEALEWLNKGDDLGEELSPVTSSVLQYYGEILEQMHRTVQAQAIKSELARRGRFGDTDRD